MLPKTSANVRTYDGQTKWMYFLIENNYFLEKYCTIWDSIGSDIKIEFDSKPVYNKNVLKTKIESQGDQITSFHDKKIPKVNSNHTF